MSINSAEAYSKNVDPLLRMIESIVNKYNHVIQNKERSVSVMDIGIGDGKIAKHVIMPIFGKNIKKFVGCDISASALEHAKNEINSSIFETIELDVGTLDLPEEMMNRFTHIFSSLCLHNIKNTRQAFKNIYNMLKPGGQIFICTFSQTPIDSAFEQLDKGGWYKYNNFQANSPFYKSPCAADEYRNIIEEVGFKNCHVQDLPNYFPRFTEDALNELYLSVNPRIPFVDDKDKKGYVEDYLNIFKNSGFVRLVDIENGKKRFDVTFKLILAVGTKPVDNNVRDNITES